MAKSSAVIEEVCETCGGTGEVSVMGYVYPGEPHMADIDTKPCPDCRASADDDDDYDPDDDDLPLPEEEDDELGGIGVDD